MGVLIDIYWIYTEILTRNLKYLSGKLSFDQYHLNMITIYALHEAHT
jgi:hypothetical protein